MNPVLSPEEGPRAAAPRARVLKSYQVKAPCLFGVFSYPHRHRLLKVGAEVWLECEAAGLMTYRGKWEDYKERAG